MWSLFLFAILPGLALGETSDAPAQRPQFRNNQPPPVLDENTHRSIGGGYTGTEGLTNIPPGAFQPDRVGVSQATLFRNTTFPYGNIIAPSAVGPTLRSENASASFKLSLPTLSGGLPWTQRGFEPQDADLKLGPFYLKLRALEAAVIHSDNINLTADHTESGTVALVGMSLGIIAQVTESLRIATTATLVYLPTEGKVGIAGFGLADIYNFGLAAGPLARAQVAWDTDIGGWHVVFADDFQVLQTFYSNEFRSDDALFEGVRFDDESRAGRYVLRPDEGAVFRNAGPHDNNTDFRTDLVAFSNIISATGERISPGSVLLRARLYHEDLWYNQGNRGQPSLREGATITLVSERENMRFKPYFIYDAFRTDEDDSVQNSFRIGMTGPITDQLFLLAEAGYYTGGIANEGGLWHVQLNHNAGPYTQESLIYAREFNYFHDEVYEALGYNVHQVLGPRLSLDAYAYRIRVEEFYQDSDLNTTRNEWRVGLRLMQTLGPRTTLRLSGEYAKIEPDQTEAWTGRIELGYSFTDTLFGRFAYQYQQSTSRNFTYNYTENLFFLSLTKYFR